MREKIREEKAITMMALAITIIVVLILASITIGVLKGNNGMIKKAEKAEDDTIISQEKEIIENAKVKAKGTNVSGKLELNELEDVLNKKMNLKNEWKVETSIKNKDGQNYLEIKFAGTGNTYEIYQ